MTSLQLAGILTVMNTNTIALPEEFIVAEATTAECLEILSEPQLLKHLPTELPKLPEYLRRHKYIWYIARFKHYAMLFFFFERVRLDGVYELHIACPKRSILASRVLSICTAKWIVKTGTKEVKALITKCPEGKISNMCTKLGGQIIYKNEVTGEVSIIITADSLKSI